MTNISGTRDTPEYTNLQAKPSSAFAFQQWQWILKTALFRAFVPHNSCVFFCGCFLTLSSFSVFPRWHPLNPGRSFVYPFISPLSFFYLHSSFTLALPARESVTIRPEQQVMDWAWDLMWLWMSQPVGVWVGVQMDLEELASNAHPELCLFAGFSCSVSVRTFRTPHFLPSKGKTGQRRSDFSLFGWLRAISMLSRCFSLSAL